VLFGVCHRYRENAQRLSRIFRDQPLTPLEQAVYWTEYVIRHKGAPHLRSAVLDLAWYQYFLLDVIAMLALAIVSLLLILFLVCRLILKKLFRLNSHEKNTDSRRMKQNWMKIICIMERGGIWCILHPIEQFNLLCYVFLLLFLFIRSNM
jgi:hypothetical protein